jgi:hypothetical protein
MTSSQEFKRAVYATPDLRRILAIPRRIWKDEDAQRLVAEWAPTLLTPKGKAELARLNLLAPEVRERELAELGRKGYPLVPSTDQIKIVSELAQYGRALTLAPVGAGKTWLMYIGATISEMYYGTRTHCVAVPAYLKDDTLDAHRRYAEYWQPTKTGIRVITYNDLGLEKNAFLLCACPACTNGAQLDDVYADIKNPPTPICPDYLGLDEADALRNVTKSAVARRVARFFSNHPSSQCKRLGGTGTLIEDSVGEMFPLLTWFLEDYAPVPFEYTEREAWCGALDPTAPRGGRYDPSVLIQAFGGDLSADDWHREARVGYGRYISETPGFLVVNKASCHTGVHMRVIPAPRDEQIENLFVPLRDFGRAVDDYIIGDSLSKRRYAVSLGGGWVDVWDPRPPTEWLAARNAYNQAVQDVIKASARRGAPLDTEKQARRFLRDSEELRTWDRIRSAPDAFVPNAVPVAVSLSTVNYVKQWLELNGPAIVFVDGTWLGETLEQVTKVLYYAEEGKSRYGTRPKAGESIIASVKANMRGRNWQAWNKVLIVGAFARAAWIEQIVGRVHRQGQESDVWVDYLAVSGESLRAFERVRERASGTDDLFGVKQKVITADWDTSLLTREYHDPESAGLGEGFAARWRRPTVAKEQDE